MTVRAAVILMLGTQVAVAAGVLTLLAGNAWALAVLAAGGAFAGTIAFARSVIG
ncbi:hypothetical protein [Streptomyces sp. NBC_01216]|uniref:hypothetical protein n=1 Tax=unclassified Streptomyces TaxID=2593676 RepID=UPI002E147AD2|nr:hypothetical protein OG393_00400 [Streptomyces sp. NBC_01216]